MNWIVKEEDGSSTVNVEAGGSTTIITSSPPKTKPKKADAVNSPAHYKVGGIETIDFIEAKGLGYNLGNVIKYITRADHKGKKLEDLKKGAWYLAREIANLEKK